MEIQIETFLRGGQFKRLMESQVSNIKQKYGLKRAELEILCFLAQCGEHNTSTDIRRCLEINKGHISQCVEHLCVQGYLTAVQDPEDRRYVHYAVTRKADLVLKDMTQLWKHLTLQIFAGISEEEMIQFRNVVCKIEHNMNRILEEGFH